MICWSLHSAFIVSPSLIAITKHKIALDNGIFGYQSSAVFSSCRLGKMIFTIFHCSPSRCRTILSSSALWFFTRTEKVLCESKLSCASLNNFSLSTCCVAPLLSFSTNLPCMIATNPAGVMSESVILSVMAVAIPAASNANGLSLDSVALCIITALICSFTFCRSTGKSTFSDIFTESRFAIAVFISENVRYGPAAM